VAAQWDAIQINHECSTVPQIREALQIRKLI